MLSPCHIISVSSKNFRCNSCLRRESGYCSVEWSTAAPYTGSGQFSVSGDQSSAPDPVTNAEAQNRDADCTADYVLIPQGKLSKMANLGYEVYCRSAFISMSLNISLGND